VVASSQTDQQQFGMHLAHPRKLVFWSWRRQPVRGQMRGKIARLTGACASVRLRDQFCDMGAGASTNPTCGNSQFVRPELNRGCSRRGASTGA